MEDVGVGSGQQRREFDRFQAQKEIFALLKPACDRLGQVRDISRGGLAFEYMRFEGVPAATDNRSQAVRLDIILGQENVLLSQVPCEIVYDMKLAGDTVVETTVEGVQLRRCGLRFGRLSPEQNTALARFIHQHAEGGASS